MAENNERAPLLGGNTDVLSSTVPSFHGTTSQGESVVGVDELPPPYTPTQQGGLPMINCKVCQALINTEGRTNQHVIKCSVCSEATPIKPPPHGKKYVRCPCNCLLICKSSSARILCPRSNCKKVITLGGGPGGHVVTTSTTPGSSRVVCAYCAQTFLFHNENKTQALARCPHCRKVSSVGVAYIRKRAIIYTCIAFIFLAAGIGVTVGTYETAADQHGYYAIWVGAFVVSFLLFLRAIYFCTIRVSTHCG